MIVDAIVPAYNERETIAYVVHVLLEAQCFGRVLVVDDGSRDGTEFAARMAGAEVVRLPVNRGKGAAIFAGVARTGAEAIALFDADAESLEPWHARAMVERFGAGLDQVCGIQDHGAWNFTLSARPLLTGQRVLRRWVLDAAPVSCGGYQIEAAINHAVEANGAASEVMVLHGARFRAKTDKLGVIAGICAWLRMMRDVRQGQASLRLTGQCEVRDD